MLQQGLLKGELNSLYIFKNKYTQLGLNLKLKLLLTKKGTKDISVIRPKLVSSIPHKNRMTNLLLVIIILF